ALRSAEERQSPVVRWAEQIYRPTLDWALRLRKVVIVGAVLSLVGAIALLRTVGSEFLPELNEGVLWVTATLPSSISFEEAHKVAPQIRIRLLGFPEVKQVVSQLGRPEDGTDAKAVNNIEFLVDLRPQREWTSARDLEHLVDKMNGILGQMPGVQYNFS